MSSHTDGTLMDDVEVIEMLERVSLDVHPPVRHDIDELLTRGRRARRHRRALIVPVSSLAIVGVAALVFATAQARTNNRQLFLAPAGLAAKQSQPSVAQSDANYQVLQEALGSEFSIDQQSGEVTVRAGSPSAQGLPTRLALSTQIFVLQQSPVSGELGQFCKPMVEKNVIFSACTTRVLADGKTVYLQKNRTGSGGVKPGRSPDYLSSDGIRVLFEQPDGSLVIVDLGTQERENDSTAARRSAAQAWLDGITPRLVNAATDPRVKDSSRLYLRPKPQRSTSRS